MCIRDRHRTAYYLAKEMKAIGLKNVEKIPVNVDKWQYNDASLTIEGTDIDMMPVSYMVCLLYTSRCV